MSVTAVGFDFFGTLVDAKADVNDCISSMCSHLHRCGFGFNDNDFLESYRATVRGYRTKRNEGLREVNNRIWLHDTLKRMGYDVKATDPVLFSTVERYFGMWQLSVFPDVYEVLERIRQEYRIGLVSNFTDSGFLLRSLRKFGIDDYFETIVVSDTIGWRKPHPRIFQNFLDSMNIEAKEAVYVGDNPEADIKGAQNTGITAVLINRQGDEGRKQGDIIPDYTISSLMELEELLSAIIN